MCRIIFTKWDKLLLVLLIIFIILISSMRVHADGNINYNKHLGEPVIWVTIQTGGAVGELHLIDEFGSPVLKTGISSGAKGFRTPSGTYKVYYKKRYHMSTKYPEDSGINNMDFSLFFLEGFALHQGDPKQSSHGCIHVTSELAEDLFEMVPQGTRVIVKRFDYDTYFATEKAKKTSKAQASKSQFSKDLSRMFAKLGGRSNGN